MTRIEPAPKQFSLIERAPAASFEEERLHRKQRLAATFRLFGRYGFDQGLAGHVTVRDPEHTDRFWINPLAKHFSLIRVSDLQLVDHRGAILIGDRPINQAGRDSRGAARCSRGRAYAFDLWQSVGRPRPAARPAHAGLVRLL